MAKVAIVIVCMNNLKNLIPCLDSIKKYTKVDYEVWLVAYMFSKENLAKLKENYPWVKIIESNEIRGFSENNNLALKRVHAKYTLVLNDDTYFTEPLVDELYDSMEKHPEAKVISPLILNYDGTVQMNGRNPRNMLKYIQGDCLGVNPDKKASQYVDHDGFYKTYNLGGACFMIGQEYFKSIGFFDEYYFFTPEDIALSTLINKKGDSCYVDTNIKMYHKGGGTRISPVKMATSPASRKGNIKFYTDGKPFKRFFLEMVMIILCGIKGLIYLFRGNKIEYKSQFNSIAAICSNRTPKEIFTKYYLQLKNKQ